MFSVDIDTSDVIRQLTDFGQRQVPYAAMGALNAVGLDVQAAERARQPGIFTLRRADWAQRSVKITHFAKRTELYVTVEISPPGGRGDILGKFEGSTEKTARGRHGVAIPINARKNKADIIVKSQRPSALELHQEGGRIVGLNGTYVVKLPDGRELILQRKDSAKRKRTRQALKLDYRTRGADGRYLSNFGGMSDADAAGARQQLYGRSDSVALYLFVPRVSIRPVLEFVPTATEVIGRMWGSRFGEALTAALASAW